MTIIYGMIVALIVGFAAYRAKFFHLAKAYDGSSKITFAKVASVFSVYILSYLLVIIFSMIAYIYLPSSAIFEDGRSFSIQFIGWVHVAVLSLATLGVVFYLLKRAGPNFFNFFKFKQNGLRPYLFGALTWLIAIPFVYFVKELVSTVMLKYFDIQDPEQVLVKQIRALTSYPWLFAATTIVVVGIVPFVEEVLFRGFLQTWLKGKYGRGAAIGITAIIFTLFHFESSLGLGNIEILSALFVLALFLGFIREREDTLLAPIGLHMTFNTISLVAVILGA